jgi:rhamnosyltransferase
VTRHGEAGTTGGGRAHGRIDGMSDVSAIIVTYEPDLTGLDGTLRALAREPCPAVVVDNSESAETCEKIREACRLHGVAYLAAGGNVGIAAAQNLAAAHLTRDRRTRFVLFLDQDSTLPEGLVARLRASFDELRALDGRAGVLAALALGPDGAPLPFRITGRLGPYQRAEVVISSGSMIELGELVASGGLREDLFIDLVDNELSWRLAGAGKFSYVDPRIQFGHRVGTGGHVAALARTAPISTPLRGYYQIRNLLLLGRSGTLGWSSVARRLVLRVGAIGLAAATHGHALSRLRFVGRGIVDGLRGRGGRIGR